MTTPNSDTQNTVNEASVKGVGTGSWFGGDTPDNRSAAWDELRYRISQGEKPKEYRWEDGTRGWLLYTMKDDGRIAILWECNRYEGLYSKNNPKLSSPNKTDQQRDEQR